MGPILGGSALLKWSAAATNIVFDGNSLVAATHVAAGAGICPQLAPLSPLNGVVNITNIGVDGQNIVDMRSRGAPQADANYVAGKKNVLIAWEGTNAIFNTGVTGETAGAQMGQYCADRLAAHSDWIIVLMTTLPRFSTGGMFTIPAGNAELSAYNAYLKSHMKDMGVKMVFDVRASGIFTYTGPTVNSAMAPYMVDDIHYNAAGGVLLAQGLAAAIKRLRAR